MTRREFFGYLAGAATGIGAVLWAIRRQYTPQARLDRMLLMSEGICRKWADFRMQVHHTEYIYDDESGGFKCVKVRHSHLAPTLNHDGVLVWIEVEVVE